MVSCDKGNCSVTRWEFVFVFSRSVPPGIQHNKFYGNIFNIILCEKCNRFKSALIFGCMC